MKCAICKSGTTQMGVTTTTLERGGSVVVFKDVPARICDNCGEAYVDETVTERLMHEANQMIAGGSELQLHHYVAA